MTFEKDAIEKAGFSTETPVIVTNTKDYLDIVGTGHHNAAATDELLTAII